MFMTIINSLNDFILFIIYFRRLNSSIKTNFRYISFTFQSTGGNSTRFRFKFGAVVQFKFNLLNEVGLPAVLFEDVNVYLISEEFFF